MNPLGVMFLLALVGFGCFVWGKAHEAKRSYYRMMPPLPTKYVTPVQAIVNERRERMGLK
jgi:hypothetical protein